MFTANLLAIVNSGLLAGQDISILDALLIAVVGMVVVIAILAVIALFILLISKIMGAIESTQTADLNATISAVPSADATPTNQIGFFAEDSRYEALASVIRDIDVDSCTPLQALTILTNLKQKVTAKSDAKSSKKR